MEDAVLRKLFFSQTDQKKRLKWPVNHAGPRPTSRSALQTKLPIACQIERSFFTFKSVEDRPFDPQLSNMIHKAIQFAGTLIAAVLPLSANAQEALPNDIFEAAAQADPNYALSFSYAFGQNDPTVMTAGPTVKDGSVLVANDARWHIGSISKSFTSTLVMRLVERGLLDLDNPVGTYLSDHKDQIHPDWKAATLRQLLSHTAGLPANAPPRTMRKTYDYAPSQGRQAVLAEMWDRPLEGEAGKFLYSNLGYVLTGFIVEEVLDMSWEEAIQSEIGTPLGLPSLGFGAPTQLDAARGHRTFWGFRRPVSPEDPLSDNPKWMGPAGTIHLSMKDLTRWGHVHLDICTGGKPDYLSHESCQIMQTPVASDYGLGWVLKTSEEEGRVVWHNGSNTMWYAMLLIVPDSNLVLALATNQFKPGPIDKLARDLAKSLIDRRDHE